MKTEPRMTDRTVAYRKARMEVASQRLTDDEKEYFREMLLTDRDELDVIAEMEALASKNPDPNPRKIPFPYRPAEPMTRYPGS